jgi:hypothetical protein
MTLANWIPLASLAKAQMASVELEAKVRRLPIEYEGDMFECRKDDSDESMEILTPTAAALPTLE